MPGCSRLGAAVLTVSLGCLAGCTHGGGKRLTEPRINKVEVVEQYWADGALRLRKEVVKDSDGTFVNHGKYTRWHDNGRMAYKVSFVHGKKDGTATLWHKNGQVWTEEQYVDGQKHGPRYVWDENGTKRKEEHFFEGKPHGTWTVWNDKGRIKSEVHFEHGVPQP